MPHYVYIATSSRLLDWAGSIYGRAAIKVGESANPSVRESWLRGRNPHQGTNVRPCAGHDDWKVVAERRVANRDEALDLEGIFKTAFEPADTGMTGAGEGDIVLLPDPPLTEEGIRRLHPAIRDLYKAARSRMHQPPREGAHEHDPPYVSDEQRDVERDVDLLRRDLADDHREGEERDDLDREDGWYYED